jgi:uncharacterized membrane protein YtjA (UPF0391 family)
VIASEATRNSPECSGKLPRCGPPGLGTGAGYPTSAPKSTFFVVLFDTPVSSNLHIVARQSEGEYMLYYALVFLLIALIAGFLGFGGVAFAAAGIAKILFFIFLVIFVGALLAHLLRGRPV